MLRKLAVAIALSSSLMSGQAMALGLNDEVDQKSALNQPLDAQIKLSDVKGLTTDEVVVSLASSEDFERYNISRDFILSNIKFDVVRNDQGEMVVKMTTNKPVKEPFLYFLIEVNWPGQKMLREYTLLFNPPVFDNNAQITAIDESSTFDFDADDLSVASSDDDIAFDDQINFDTTASSNDSISFDDSSDDISFAGDEISFADDSTTNSMASDDLISFADIESSTTVTIPGDSDDDMMDLFADDSMVEVPGVVPRSNQAESGISANGRYFVKNNDTLWEIALDVRPNNEYTAQQVMLAIQDLNPNAFINSNINRLKAGTMLDIPTAVQIAARDQGQAVAQVSVQNGNSNIATEGTLSAADDLGSALISDFEGYDPDGSLELVSPGVSDFGDNLNASDLEGAERIAALENELSIAYELNDKFDRDRMELTSKIAELEEQVALMEDMIELSNETGVNLQNLSNQVDQTTDQMVDDQVTPELDLSVVPQVDNTVVDPVVDTTAPVIDTTPAVTTPVDNGFTPLQQPVTPVVPQKTGIAKIIDDVLAIVMANITYIGGGLAVLLLGGLLLAKRKKPEQDDDVADIGGDLNLDDLNDGLDDPLGGDVLAGFDDDLDDFGQAGAEKKTDVIAAADEYIAFGRLENAESILNEAYLADQSQTEVAIKLLTVLADQNKADDFANIEAKVSMGASQEILSQIEVAKSLMDGPSLDDLESDLMGMDDFDSGVSGDFAGIEDASSVVEPSFESAGALEPETLDDAIPELEQNDFTADSLDSGLDLDLSDDLELTDDFAETSSPELILETPSLDDSLTAKPAEDDFASMNFDLDDSALTSQPAAEEKAESLDFDLGEPEASEELPTLDEVDLDFSLDDAPTGDISDDNGLESLDLEDNEDFASFEAETTEDIGSFDLEETDLGSMELDSADTDLGSLDLNDELSVDDINLDVEQDEPVTLTEVSQEESAPIESLDDDLGAVGDDEFDFLAGADEASTKLDLARAYIDMEDNEGAKDILEEVIQDGSDEQKSQAKELLNQLA